MRQPDMNSGEQAGRGRLPAFNRDTVVLLLVVLGVFVASAEPVRMQTGHMPLVGVYTLTNYSAHGDKPTGRLAYEPSGRMWIMLLPPDRHPLTNSSAPEEYRDTMRRVVAYYGTYTLDEPTGRVIHHVAEASNPAWIGENFIRWYRLDGSGLTLSLNAEFDKPLTWKRMSDSTGFIR